jgi:hypothetical protein
MTFPVALRAGSKIAETLLFLTVFQGAFSKFAENASTHLTFGEPAAVLGNTRI